MIKKIPPALRIAIQILAYALVAFSLIFLSDTAREGQRYREKVDPVVEKILTESKSGIDSAFTLSEDQRTALASAHYLNIPKSTPEVSTVRLLFILGVVLMVFFRENAIPKDRTTFPND